MDKIIGLLEKYYPVYLQGLWGTLWISAVTVLLGTVLGVLVAVLRMSRSKVLNGIAGAYIEVLRGTPILLQLYFFWIGLPKLLPFMELSDTQCIVVALVINASAYIAEIIRAGIGAVDKGQWEAARSIGLTEAHMMTHVIMPQAVKNILPTLINEFIALLKETAVAGYIALGDLTRGGDQIRSQTWDAFPPLLAVAAIYLIMVMLLEKVGKVIERRLAQSDRG